MRKILLTVVFLAFSTFFTLGQSVSCKTFLQGAYQSGSAMNTAINSLIPGAQPYNVDPWNYPGIESLNSIPLNMVDWVLVELRDPANPAILVSRRAGVLLSNGDITDTNLITSVAFSEVPVGDYFLCIHHRNHLPVMTANPIPFPNTIAYDFSDTLNFPPYGGGVDALIELEPGIFGMIAGDVNKDRTIKYSGPNNDRGLVLQHIVNESGSTNITTIDTGYHDEDINMDSIVKYSGPGNDPSLIIQNLVGLTGSTAITSVFSSPVPKEFVCGDLLHDARNNKKYNTVQIGEQCWMAENLNVGVVLNSQNFQIDNDTLEKYCYDNNPTNCETYGGLYQWDEMMQYKTLQFNDGICPEGWHLPTDDEWFILENFVDTSINDPVAIGWRGIDAGTKLKTGGLIGFDALLGGAIADTGSMFGMNNLGYFWSSTSNGTNSIYRVFSQDSSGVERNNYSPTGGFSVRCVKGYPNIINGNIIIIDTNTTALLSDSAQLAQGIYVFHQITRDTLIIDTSNIIIGTTDEGYLRKVINVLQSTPDSLILQTDSATLEDVFVSGEFYIETGLYDSTQNRLLNRGLRIMHLAKGVTVDQTRSGGFLWNFNNVTLYQNGPINLSIPSGYVEFDPNFKFEFKFKKRRVLKLAFYTNDALLATSVDLDLNVTQASQILDEEFTLASHIYIFGIVVGVVPVIVVIKTDLKAYSTIDVDAAFSATTGYTNNNTLTVGLIYEYNNGGWRKLFNLNKATNLHPLIINGNVNLIQEVKLVPEVSVKFYGVAGPYFNIEGYEELLANLAIPSVDFDANLKVGLNANIGAEIGIFGYTLAKYNKQLFGFNKELWNLPDQLIMVSGNNQSGNSNQQLSNPVKVKVVDNLGNPWPFIPVHFNITNGGGALSDASVMTDVNGYAQTTWTLGPNPGQNTLTANVVKADGTDIDGSPLQFDATATGTSSCPSTFVDCRDNNPYSAIQIGNQCWMAENLNYTTSNSWCYSNNSVNCDIYGRLYTWYAVMAGEASSNSVPSGVQGICPSGWHLPSDEEWKILEGEVDSQYGYPDQEWNGTGWRGADVGGNLKETGTTHWYSPNTGATNNSGFTALPAGRRSFSGSFYYLGNSTAFWSSTENYSSDAWLRSLHCSYADVYRYFNSKSRGFSVRCCKD